MRRITLALACVLLLTVGFVTPASAQERSLTIAVDCDSNPERVTITNRLATTLNVVTISSINDPRSNEPFFIPNSGLPFEVAVGGSVSFTSGSGASGNVLTRQFIFDNEAANEGVRVSIGPEFITGQNGPLTFDVLCTQGSRTFAFPGTTTTTTVRTATTRTTAPAALPNAGGGGLADSEPAAAGLLTLFGLSLAGGVAAYRRKVASS